MHHPIVFVALLGIGIFCIFLAIGTLCYFLSDDCEGGSPTFSYHRVIILALLFAATGIVFATMSLVASGSF